MAKSNDIRKRALELLNEEFSNKDWYVVEIKTLPNNLVQIFIDRDSSFTIEDCATISRMLEKKLNEEMNFSDHFALEVSSPGVDRPLTLPRQYKKNIGRKISAETLDGKKTEGKLVSADDEKIGIETVLKKTTSLTEIRFDDLKQSKVLISF